MVSNSNHLVTSLQWKDSPCWDPRKSWRKPGGSCQYCLGDIAQANSQDQYLGSVGWLGHSLPAFRPACWQGQLESGGMPSGHTPIHSPMIMCYTSNKDIVKYRTKAWTALPVLFIYLIALTHFRLGFVQTACKCLVSDIPEIASCSFFFITYLCAHLSVSCY